ncbi:hypothetical protein ABK040_012674 [Willaertia magna]
MLNSNNNRNKDYSSLIIYDNQGNFPLYSIFNKQDNKKNIIVNKKDIYDPDYKVQFLGKPFTFINEIKITNEEGNEDLLNIKEIIKIECKYNHILILTENGVVYSFGEYLNGKLGFESDEDIVTIPRFVMNEAIDISTGKEHSAIVTQVGDVYTFGNGIKGQLGHGNVKSENIPKRIDFFLNANLNVIQVSCGDYFTLCLCSNGNVYGFGCGSSGQLGILCHITDNVPFSKLSIQNKSQVMYSLSPKVMHAVRPVKQTSDEFKRLKMKQTFLCVKKIACGSSFTALLTKEGRIYTLGDGSTGVISNGTFKSKNFSVSLCQFKKLDTYIEKYVNVDFTIENEEIKTIIELKGKVIEPTSLEMLNNSIRFIDIRCGWGHLLCLTEDERIFVSGLNHNGQLGLGKTFKSQNQLIELTKYLPKVLIKEGIQQIECGQHYSLILSNRGNVYGCGRIPGNVEDLFTFTLMESFNNNNNNAIEQLFGGSDKGFIVSVK